MKLFSVWLLLCALALAACSLGDLTGAAVPTTGNTANDPTAAQQYLPNLTGYLSTDAATITDGLAAVGGSAALISGNPIAAAIVAQIDVMINCYRSVGAVAARIYAENNLGGLVQGQIPKVGALAVINQDRLVNNFLPCALGQSRTEAQSAAPQPCAGSGSFRALNGETIHYLYAATDQVLCDQFRASFPQS